MPIKIPDNLPAVEILNNENIFVMNESRAYHQDIRRLKIAILNLMPTKIVTETQLLRLISNSFLQIDVTLLHIKSDISKDTTVEHLNKFYSTFDEIKDQKFDGLIISGAPFENFEFEEISFWDELKEIMEWGLHKDNWKGHANILFANWLNYYVYQETPYDLSELVYYI